MLAGVCGITIRSFVLDNKEENESELVNGLDKMTVRMEWVINIKTSMVKCHVAIQAQIREQTTVDYDSLWKVGTHMDENDNTVSDI